MIYFMRASIGAGHVKIGWSLDPSGRIAQLRTGQPFEVEVFRTLDAPKWTEKWLHDHFSSARVIREWFEYRDEMLTIVPPAERPVRRVVGPGGWRPSRLPGGKRSVRIELDEENTAAVRALAKAEERLPTAMVRLLIRRGLKISRAGEDKSDGSDSNSGGPRV